MRGPLRGRGYEVRRPTGDLGSGWGWGALRSEPEASDQPTLDLCRRNPAAYGRDQGRLTTLRVRDVFAVSEVTHTRKPRVERGATRGVSSDIP